MTIQGVNRNTNDQAFPARPASVSPAGRDLGPVLPDAGAFWPKNAMARIQKAERSATTSGMARTKGWRLTFERRSRPDLEPLMGWTTGEDPLAQIELSFPTLQAAIRYAEGQGLAYEVIPPPGAADRDREEAAARARTFSDATLSRLGLGELQVSYDRAMSGAAERDDPVGAETWDDPMEVVTDPALSLEAKRSVLMNWAWYKYLAGLATAEGMPENGRPSRSAEVKQALRTLEGRASTPAGTPGEIRLAAGREAMNPLLVFDANRVVPDPFALAMAAAARARALRQGAEPRIDAEVAPGSHLALSEIAAGAFPEEELPSFRTAGPGSLASGLPKPDWSFTTAAKGPPPHPSSWRGRFTDPDQRGKKGGKPMMNNYFRDGHPTDVINILAGLGLVLSPWILDFAAVAAAAWNAWLVGAAIALLALWDLVSFRKIQERVIGLLGLWAIFARWVLGFGELSSATAAHVVLGLVAAVVAAGTLWSDNDWPHLTV